MSIQQIPGLMGRQPTSEIPQSSPCQGSGSPQPFEQEAGDQAGLSPLGQSAQGGAQELIPALVALMTKLVELLSMLTGQKQGDGGGGAEGKVPPQGGENQGKVAHQGEGAQGKAPKASGAPASAPTPSASKPAPKPGDNPGHEYYASPNGSDSGDGSAGNPWSLNKANQSAQAGDTVFFRGGTYNGQLKPANSGSEGKDITFAAYPGERPTIDGTGVNVPGWSGLVDIRDKSNIRISGFNIQNSQWAGIYADNSSNITADRNYISDTRSSGILMANGSNYVADGNELNHASMGTPGGGVDGRGVQIPTNQEQISFQNAQGFEIKNNNIHDGGQSGGAEGIVLKMGTSNGTVHDNAVTNVQSTGIYADAYSKSVGNIEIYGNKLTNTGTNGIGVSGETGGSAHDIDIHDNVISGLSDGAGIRIPEYAQPGANGQIQNIKVHHNEVSNSAIGVDLGYWTDAHIDGLTVQDNTLRNNKTPIQENNTNISNKNVGNNTIQ
ncbi:MAG: right-handed parallel beta-helix repeat-containing protein [Armatimonadetes bacterium]|nr:right-handed parallel beta-helix repeat-containing protein [Armatimonadota bacterium]